MVRRLIGQTDLCLILTLLPLLQGKIFHFISRDTIFNYVYSVDSHVVLVSFFITFFLLLQLI